MDSQKKSKSPKNKQVHSKRSQFIKYQAPKIDLENFDARRESRKKPKIINLPMINQDLGTLKEDFLERRRSRMERKTVSFEAGYFKSFIPPYLQGSELLRVNQKDPIDLMIEQIERQVEKKRKSKSQLNL